MCIYRLNWARKRRTSWGWWDDWDDTANRIEYLKFESWRSEGEHATFRYNIESLWVSGEETFCFFETWKPEWGSNPRSPTFQAGSFNHCTIGRRPWPANRTEYIRWDRDNIRGQQAQDIHPLFLQCWSTVYDACPTLSLHWVNVSCLPDG